MTRRHWSDPYSSAERTYGLGIAQGKVGAWEHFGHGGGFQGTLTRTACFPAAEVTISVLTNAIDGPSQSWMEGIAHILQTFSKHGAPARRTAPWRGRWWSLWSCADLVPMGDRVLVGAPSLLQPFTDASEIEILGPGAGRIARAAGYASHGEPVRLVRSSSGRPSELWFAGSKLLPEAKYARELRSRFRLR